MNRVQEIEKAVQKKQDLQKNENRKPDSGVQWTPEQTEAIERRDQNLLVAAAAGSGKTAVLVERIKRLILEERCPIDRMLIVTFTNAAASEMKEKIEKAVRKEIDRIAVELAEAPAESEGETTAGETAGDSAAADAGTKDRAALQRDLLFLKKQLDLLPSANISTFHAFALEVIRRYFYIIDAEPNFKICDNSRQLILRGQAMDELLEEFFAADDAAFYDFLQAYSSDRNENRFRQIIESTFDTIQSLPEPAEWLHEKTEELNPARGIEAFADGPVMQELWEDTRKQIEKAKLQLVKTAEFAELHGLDSVQTLTREDLRMAEELESLAAARNFDGMTTYLEGFRLKALSKKIFVPTADFDESGMADVKDMVEQNRSILKSCAKELKTAYFCDTFQNIAEDVYACYPSACFLERALLRYGEIYAKKKRNAGLLDFNDIEHDAYEILKDEEAAAFYREKFLHIFVDEYQDSNVIQEALIERLQSGRNLFTVGDIKQSIYMFRLAEPEIFRARYRSYDALTAAQGEESTCRCIDLNRNFRSKTGVIAFINDVFRDAMEDYDERAALYPGDPFASRRSARPVLYLAQTPWDEVEELDDELKTLLKAEKEALAAVKIIREHLGQTIYDSKAKKERPLQKKDIVILMRSAKNYGDLFYKILTENNLPAYVDDNDGFFDTIEINTFMALLALLDNPKQDIPLLTVLRSEIFDFSIEELTAVRIAHKEGSYYQALAACAGEGKPIGEAAADVDMMSACAGDDREGTIWPAELHAKCAGVLRTLRVWTQLAGLLPLDELIWELLLESGFYIAMGAMPGGSRRQANLRALIDKARAYQGSQGGSLYGFIEYINAVKQRKVSMGQVKMAGEDDDTIRIMTIHKSKGLEFPMVLLAGYCRRLNYTTLSKGPVLHKTLGLGFPVVNYREGWYRTGITQKVIRAKIRKEEAAEEKRVLYVAMTRARDFLCLLGIEDDPEGAVKKVLTELPKDSSYFSMTGKTICRHVGGYVLLSNAELAGLSRGRRRAAANVLRMLEQEDAAAGSDQPQRSSEPAVDPQSLAAQIAAQMTFRYPFEKDLKIKSKYAVSELTQVFVRPNANADRGAASGSAAEDAGYSKTPVFVSKNSGFASERTKQPAVRPAEDGEMETETVNLAEPASFRARSSFTAAQIGTFTHKVLEKLDFCAVRAAAETEASGTEDLPGAGAGAPEDLRSSRITASVRELLDKLVAEEHLTREEAAAVDVKKIAAFAGSELGRRIAASPQVRREQPFNLMMEVDGSMAAVQGILDCCFEEDGAWVLLDYKTTRIESAAELARRLPQLRKTYGTQMTIYRRALEAATGMQVRETYLYLTNLGETVRM